MREKGRKKVTEKKVREREIDREGEKISEREKK